MKCHFYAMEKFYDIFIQALLTLTYVLMDKFCPCFFIDQFKSYSVLLKQYFNNFTIDINSHCKNKYSLYSTSFNVENKIAFHLEIIVSFGRNKIS